MRFCVAIVAVLLASCTEFPALDGTISEGARLKPYPRLVALDGILLNGSTEGSQVSEYGTEADKIAGRIAALQRRASALRAVNFDG